MQQSIVSAIATSVVVSSASADFIGWTSTVRTVEAGLLVNVFAVTNSAGDRLMNVYGGRPSNPGLITTTAPGGFLQSSGARGAFRPAENQSWNDRDSFLTIGGGFDPGPQDWLTNASTLGDPGWMFPDSDGSMTDGFSATSTLGSTNPWTNAVPTGAGWYATGTGAVARSLDSISSIRLGFSMDGGVRLGASSAAAAAGSYGVLVAQLFVADLDHSRIEWTMGATVRRSNGTAHQGEFSFVVTNVPGPGAFAAFLILANRRRRRR